MSDRKAKQVQLKQKDQQLLELQEALEISLKSNASHRAGRGIGGDEEHVPKLLLRRVDVDGRIWILAEYREPGIDDGWLCL